MRRIGYFAVQEFKQIFRDRMLLLFFIFPVFQFCLLKYGVPALAQQFPIIIEYYAYINMFGAMQVAILFGIITSFILLDEKDEQLINVLRVLPLTWSIFLLNKLFVLTIFTMIGAWIMLQYTGLGPIDPGVAWILSIQFGLLISIVTLSMGVLAANKVQGMAYFKGINLILIIPVIAFFFGPIIKYVCAPIPIFWTFHAYLLAVDQQAVWLELGIGFLVYGLVIYILAVQFKRVVWNGIN